MTQKHTDEEDSSKIEEIKTDRYFMESKSNNEEDLKVLDFLTEHNTTLKHKKEQHL